MSSRPLGIPSMDCLCALICALHTDWTEHYGRDAVNAAVKARRLEFGRYEDLDRADVDAIAGMVFDDLDAHAERQEGPQ